MGSGGWSRGLCSSSGGDVRERTGVKGVGREARAI